MSRQGDHYEPTIAFWLHVYDKDKQLVDDIFLQEKMILPVSKKEYKITAKNLQVYCQELLQVKPEVVRIEIDRISFVGVLDRST
jgi:DNA-binding GntR family transcriptional regulator